MPRLRKYVSTTVPVIGCDMAKSRRADSGDPAGADDGRGLGSGSGSGRGRLRKRRASSATSLKSRRPQLSRMRSEEHTSELQSLMRISYAVFCLKKKKI